MSDQVDKAREEFLSEAQEIVETLSRNLLELDTSVRAGTADPGLVNEAFRAVHTLKGLAGLFGAGRLGHLSHRLEDLLDDLRLGRMALVPAVLDVLFSAVEAYGRLLAMAREGGDETIPAVDELLVRLVVPTVRHDVPPAVRRERADPGTEADLPGDVQILGISEVEELAFAVEGEASRIRERDRGHRRRRHGWALGRRAVMAVPGDVQSQRTRLRFFERQMEEQPARQVHGAGRPLRSVADRNRGLAARDEDCRGDRPGKPQGNVRPVHEFFRIASPRRPRPKGERLASPR
jgi:chemotaxis protein histidine kinase CheA